MCTSSYDAVYMWLSVYRQATAILGKYYICDPMLWPMTVKNLCKYALQVPGLLL